MRWLDGITDSMDMSLSKLGDGEGQGSLACCSPWGHKESDTLSNNKGESAAPPLGSGEAEMNLIRSLTSQGRAGGVTTGQARPTEWRGRSAQGTWERAEGHDCGGWRGKSGRQGGESGVGEVEAGKWVISSTKAGRGRRGGLSGEQRAALRVNQVAGGGESSGNQRIQM